jgi:hypothetical protein
MGGIEDAETFRRRLANKPEMKKENDKILKDYWKRNGRKLIKYDTAPRGIRRILDSENYSDFILEYLGD